MPFKRGAILSHSFSAYLDLFPLHAAPKAATPARCAARSPTPPAPSFPARRFICQRGQRPGPDRLHRCNRPVRLSNIPFNPYRISVSANGFAPLSQSFEIRSVVGTNLNLVLQVAAAPLRPSPSRHRATWSRPTPPSTPTWTATVHQGAAGERVLRPQFAGDALHARRGRRLQRPLSRPRRPRFELLFRGRPVDHRPAEQGLLQPDSRQLDSIHRSDQRRAAGRVWRQDQPGDCGHHPLRPGSHQARRQHQAPMAPSGRPRPASIWPTAARTGAISSRPTASTPAAFSIPRSSPSSTTRATSKTLFDRVDYNFTRPIHSSGPELQPLLVPDARTPSTT
jgi:hypothetical protein